MSHYCYRETGIIPGQRDRPTGPVTLYQYSDINDSKSRGLNPTESQQELRKLEDEMEKKLDRLRAGMARKFLRFLRKRLLEFDTHRHKITVFASMGTVDVLVHGKRPVSEYRHHTPVIDRLQEIDQLLSCSWDWAQYLDGEQLN